MSSSKLAYTHKYLSLHANDNAENCFLTSSNNLQIYTEQQHSVKYQELSSFNSSRPKDRLYILSNVLTDIHEINTAARAQQKALQKRALPKNYLDHMLRDIRQHFDISENSPAIDHSTWTCISNMDIGKPDMMQQQLKKVLLRSIEGNSVIFHMEQGYNGTWHFHVMSQGYIKKHKQVAYRTGWSYIKYPNDRKPIEDFNRTASYCLCKYHANKRNYIKVTKVNR